MWGAHNGAGGRFRQLEQKVLAAAVEVEVLRWEGVEGVDAWMGGGRTCKVKTGWWLAAAAHVVQSGCSKGAGSSVETQERAAPGDQAAAGGGQRVGRVWALEVFAAANKVEAAYKRFDGLQGAL